MHLLYVAGLLRRIGLMLITLLFMTTAIKAQSFTDAAEEGVIRRHNYGVLFRYQQHITAYDEKYTHHVILNLPPNAQSILDKQVPNDTLHTNGKYMKSLHNITSALDPTQEGFNRELLITQQLIQEIYDLFPYAILKTNKRNRRRWCVILCSDVGFQNDIEILKAFAANASEINTQNFVKVQTALTAMASYSTINNEKFQTLKLIMERQEQNAEIRQRFALSQQHFTSLLVNVLIPNMAHVMSLRSSLLLLKSKVLTYDIIPASSAPILWRKIQQHVARSSRYVAEDDALSLYDIKDITLFRMDATLHIGLSIKLSPVKYPLILFETEQLPMRYPGSTHTTSIAKLPRFIAINDIDKTFLSFNERPHLQFNKYYNMRQNQHFLHGRDEVSCLTALLYDNVPFMHNLCETLIQPFTYEPFIRHLARNFVIMQDIDRLVLESTPSALQQTSRDVFPNCTSLCVQQYPCDSIIRYHDQLILLPHCATRDEDPNEADTTYVLNLHVLAPLLSAETQATFSASEVYLSPLNMHLPELTNDTIASNKALWQAYDSLGVNSLKLINDMNQTLDKGLVFLLNETYERPPDIWVQTGTSIQSGWRSFVTWMGDPFGLTSKILTLLHIMVTLYILYRLNAILTAVAMLQISRSTATLVWNKIPQVQVHERILMTIPAQISIPIDDTGKVQNLSNSSLATANAQLISFPFGFSNHTPQLSNDYHVLDVMIWLTLTTILIYVIVNFTSKKVFANTTEVILELFNDADRITLRLGRIPHLAKYYTFKTTAFVDKVRISGGIFPQVNLIWPTLTVKHKHLHAKINLPLNCRVHWLKALRLRRMIKTPFELLVFLKDSEREEYCLLPIEGTDWTHSPVRLEQPPEYV